MILDKAKPNGGDHWYSTLCRNSHHFISNIRGLHRKGHLLSNDHASAYVDKPVVGTCTYGIVWKDSCTKDFLHACCLRRIVKQDNDTPVTVFQHSVKWPDEAVCLIIAMQLRYTSSRANVTFIRFIRKNSDSFVSLEPSPVTLETLSFRCAPFDPIRHIKKPLFRYGFIRVS